MKEFDELAGDSASFFITFGRLAPGAQAYSSLPALSRFWIDRVPSQHKKEYSLALRTDEATSTKSITEI
ncbi:MAG: hypothetical protein NHB36_12450 [Nitrospira sp.]|nr:hypothetical protein [Nitrospira sp.]